MIYFYLIQYENAFNHADQPQSLSFVSRLSSLVQNWIHCHGFCHNAADTIPPKFQVILLSKSKKIVFVVGTF